MWAPLPVDVTDPARCLTEVAHEMKGLKRSGQAVGAQVLTNLAGFAPPTILSQAARLQARQPFFNLVVTNVPGPQFPLYLLARRMLVLYPIVPLARRQALGIAVMSYDGHLGFGLLGDYDALPDLDELAHDLSESIAALSRAARAKSRATARSKAAQAKTGQGRGSTSNPPAAPREGGARTRAKQPAEGVEAHSNGPRPKPAGTR